VTHPVDYFDCDHSVAIDGDTIRCDLIVRLPGKTIIWPDVVRLLGVDCPERNSDSDAWLKARAFTMEWLASPVMLECRRKRDKYGRLLATVIKDGSQRLHEDLIAAGHGVVRLKLEAEE
jgi:endonuclease YncB( thermonuclease family)